MIACCDLSDFQGMHFAADLYWLHAFYVCFFPSASICLGCGWAGLCSDSIARGICLG